MDAKEEKKNRLKEAALNGDIEAQFELGKWYITQLYTSLNNRLSILWFTKAAKAGHSQAQVWLGDLLISDYDDKKNQKAIEWYKQAIKNNNPKGMIALAYMYKNGLGVEEDYGKTLELYNQALLLDDAEAYFHKGSIYYFGDGVEQSYTRAAELFEIAANKGDDSDALELAVMYALGKGVERDYEKSFRWLDKTYENGNPDASLCYVFSFKVGEIDPELAKETLSGTNLYYLAEWYDGGWGGIPNDPAMAAQLYEVSIKKGCWQSLYQLALLYIDGRGVQKDVEKGMELMKEAANKGCGLAQNYLEKQATA